MSDTIPDLWPSYALKTNIRTPVAILRAQATRLSQNTQGLLVAEVIVTAGENDQVILGLEVLAPALNNYRYRLLSVQYTQDEIYPARVTAKGLKITRTISRFTLDKEVVVESVGSKTAFSEEEFIKILQEVLKAPETVAILQSLIVRSNEVSATSVAENQENDSE